MNAVFRLRRAMLQDLAQRTDVTILARIKVEVLTGRAAIALELACRKWSLIPQSSKFIIQQAKSLEDALGTLPSIVASASRGDDEPELDASDAERIMREALKGKPLKVVDKTRLRYVLYRASPTTRILRRCLDLLPRHPEHIDAFMAYLSNYSHSTLIMDRVRGILKEGVLYDYVEGELWQLAASIGEPSDLRRLMGLFKKRSKNKDRSMPLEWGLLTFAAASTRAEIYPRSSLTNRVSASDPYLQSLVIPFLDEREFRRQGVIGKLLRQPQAEPGLVIATRLVERNLTHRSFGVRPSQLAPQVRNAFQGIGLLAPRPAEKFDQIGDILKWPHLRQQQRRLRRHTHSRQLRACLPLRVVGARPCSDNRPAADRLPCRGRYDQGYRRSAEGV